LSRSASGVTLLRNKPAQDRPQREEAFMSQALIARATSFGASALLMGGLVLLALTMSYTVQVIDFGPTPPPIEIAVPEPPPTPPPTPATRQQTPTSDERIELSPLTPMEPVSDTAPTEPYFGPVAPTGPVEITSPRWLQRPHNLARYYPARAVDRAIEGEVMLDCLVSTAGALDCRVLTETPTGWGFGNAARRIAQDHRMAPAMADGRAVEGRYRMRVPFELE
jgi:periplasmic protein TonB